MLTESSLAALHTMLRQFFKYMLIGLLTNLSGYVLYLLMTHFWGMPKLTMTMLYSIGAAVGFFANRRFSFRHDGHVGKAGLRYLLAQLSGYLLNLLFLLIFVDWFGFPHQIVQAAAIVVVAIFLFLLARFFVFSDRSGRSAQSSHESLP